jgi:hypothetical protein
MRAPRTELLVLALLAATPALAFEFQCPETIMTRQIASAPPGGWSPFVRDPWGNAGNPDSVAVKSTFSKIELYDGEPKEIADLKPDNDVDTWTFGKPQAGDRPTFMACVYGDTHARLVRELPKGIKKCRASKAGKLTCETY